MPKKTCPNGHVYDSDIYGDQCPLCPQGGSETQIVNPGPSSPVRPRPTGDIGGGGEHTHIGHPQNATQDPIGDTLVRTDTPNISNQPAAGGHTVIRRTSNNGSQTASGRKLVGFLVTYNRNPMGKSYNLYEGRNFVGRDKSCDVSVPEDNQMSGRHMSILYRNVDNKFKFRDEQSSNGTFVNRELMDDGELNNHDLIRVGGTVFIFMAIPKLN